MRRYVNLCFNESEDNYGYVAGRKIEEMVGEDKEGLKAVGSVKQEENVL